MLQELIRIDKLETRDFAFRCHVLVKSHHICCADTVPYIYIMHHMITTVGAENKLGFDVVFSARFGTIPLLLMPRCDLLDCRIAA